MTEERNNEVEGGLGAGETRRWEQKEGKRESWRFKEELLKVSEMVLYLFRQVSNNTRIRRSQSVPFIAVALLVTAILMVSYGQHRKAHGDTSQDRNAIERKTTTRRCYVYQNGGIYEGGYGDRIKNTYRSAIVAEQLGCVLLKQPKITIHGYDNANITRSFGIDQTVKSICNVNEAFNVDRINNIDNQCDYGNYAAWKPCDVWILDQVERWDLRGLQCIKKVEDYLNLDVGPMMVGEGVIHYRQGDLSYVKPENDFRRLTDAELYEMIRIMKEDLGLRHITVFTEGLLHLREGYEDVEVSTESDAATVMVSLASAEAIGVSSSGFVIAPLQMFKGRALITTDRAKVDVLDMIARHRGSVIVRIVKTVGD